MRSRLLGPALTLFTAAGLALPPHSAVAHPAALPTHVNDCWSSDNGPVVLDSLAISPRTVDVTHGPATVHVVAEAHDTGGPGPATGVARMRLATTAGDARLHREGGRWIGTLKIPQGAPARQASGDIVAVDKGGRTSDLPAEGSSGYVVTVTDTDPDHSRPVLHGLDVPRHHVDSTRRAQRVAVTATVTDAGSGVAQVFAGTRFPPFAGARLSRVPGTHHYRGTMTIPRWSGHHSGYVTVRAYDRLGNELQTNARDVHAAGFHAFLRITSGPIDDQPPRLVRVVRMTHHVDVRRHRARALVEVVLADERAVRRPTVTLGFGHGYLNRVSGTAQRGVWRGTLRVPRCGVGPGSRALYLNATDGVHGELHRLGRLHVRAHDRVPFEGREVGPVGDDFTVRFDEPVHGISATNVLVEDVHRQPLAGSWTCHAGSGTTVSCLTASVRTATFTLADSTAVPDLVVWGPPGHLDVLDRAGNPADGSLELDD